MENKHVKTLILIAAFLILGLVTTASYAYFVALINGNDNASNTAITTGYMEVTFEDGPEITTDNMTPGDVVEKTFSVTNTGNVVAAYGIYFNDVLNTFKNKDELVYELISANGANVSQSDCPSLDAPIMEDVIIDVGQTHRYTLKITFLNKDYSQDENQGKAFSSIINISKLYDNVNTETKALRTAYNDEMVYDENFFSFDEFGSRYGAYLKQNVTKNYTTVSDDYYVFIEDYRQEEGETLENCNNDLYNQYSSSCYEKDGRIWFHRKSDEFSSLDECKEANYMYNSDTGEYYVENTEDFHGECVLVSGESRNRVINQYTDDTSYELCFYNSGNEICFNDVLPYSLNDLYYTSESYTEEVESNLNTLYMNVYNNLNSKKRFVCVLSTYATMYCTSDDNEAIVYDMLQSDGGTTLNFIGKERYTRSSVKIVYDSIEQCMNEHSRNCVLIDNQVVYYDRANPINASFNPYYTYDSLESCQNTCNYNEECYCVRHFVVYRREKIKQCFITGKYGECSSGGWM